MEDIIRICDQKVDEIAYIIGDFGKEVEKTLIDIAEKEGAKGTIYYQDEPLGTAHAILCAAPSLSGHCVVAFADTLFSADFKLDKDCDGIIWVKQIDDPKQFGVVKVNSNNIITDFVEKPQEFISDLAIIGIYYVSDGDNLKKELQFLIDNDIKDKGEYQLTNALENMKNKGMKLKAGKVDEWLDCGNKDATVYTNQRVLEIKYEKSYVAKSAKVNNSVINHPCYIDENVMIENAVVGPFVTLGAGTNIRSSVVRNSIIQKNTTIENATIDNSLIGNFAKYKGRMSDLSMGDYSVEV